MESDHKEPKPKLRLGLDQEKPSNKKKGILKKIKEFIINGLEKRASGEGRDWGDW